MREKSTKLAVASLILSSWVLTGEAIAHSPAVTARGTWVCNAYGYGGTRNQWRSVTGEHQASRVVAEASAMRECQSKLNGCQRSGCWQGE